MDASAAAAAFRQQAQACASDGRSPLYASLLERAAEDVEAGGPLASLLEGWEGHPVLDALAMRLLGAAHAEVLAGRAPALARHYPSAGGRFEADAAWRALRELAESRPDALRAGLARQVQTNEVARSAALLGGFLEVAQATGLPLRVLEIGASAGLNLIWDRHRYRLGGRRWGDPAAPVCVECDWQGPPAALAAPLRVASRQGCDLSPVDLEDPEARLRLESFVWPDQPERLALLRAAIAVARAERPAIAQARARDWLPSLLDAGGEGVATVLFQSVMWWYLPEDERAEVTRTMQAAGARATPEAPLFWLRMEGSQPKHAEVRLLSWPAGEDRHLADAHWHGRWVRWLPR